MPIEPPEELETEAERAAWRDGALTGLAVVQSNVSALASDFATEDDGDDEDDPTCPDCGAELVRELGGYRCTECGHTAEADSTQ